MKLKTTRDTRSFQLSNNGDMWSIQQPVEQFVESAQEMHSCCFRACSVFIDRSQNSNRVQGLFTADWYRPAGDTHVTDQIAYFFIYDLLNDVASNLDIIKWQGRSINEQWTENNVEGSGRGTIYEILSWHSSRELRKITIRKLGFPSDIRIVHVQNTSYKPHGLLNF